MNESQVRHLLAARARELARLPPDTNQDASPEFVEVAAGRARFALAIEFLLGVSSVQHIAPVPGVSLRRGGLTVYRGQPLVAFHLSGLVSGSQAMPAEHTHALALGRARPEAALLIESVLGVRQIAQEGLSPRPSSLRDEAQPWVLGVTDDGVLALDVAKMLASEALFLKAK